MNVEELLLESVVRKVPAFSEAVDAFVSRLLAEAGYGGRPTDGVHFVCEEFGDHEAFAFGIAVMIQDQCVEPLRVQLGLNAARSGFASGLVQFGIRGHAAVPHGSREHHQMTRRMLANRNLEFDWKEQFQVGPHGWRRLPLSSA